MRLIDADAFLEFNEELVDREIEHPLYQNTVRDLINDAPTVELMVSVKVNVKADDTEVKAFAEVE